MATILIVEDNPLLADCYARWLQAAGYQVCTVGDAQAALDAMDVALPAAIVLDILLHGANGLQLLQVLRSHRDFSRVPIVLCSSVLPQPVPDLRAYGVVAALDKTTLNRRLLSRTIQEALHAAVV